jgi:hypothetical protein
VTRKNKEDRDSQDLRSDKRGEETQERSEVDSQNKEPGRRETSWAYELYFC